MKTASLEFLKSIYSKHGVEDNSYLETCYNRFITTKANALSGVEGKIKILDIGAHYLSASIFYAMEGHEVIGADLFLSESENAMLAEIAEEFGIRLITYQGLSNPTELGRIEDGSIDLVLFAEILEHITFNPTEFWKEVYRLLKPNGRIVLTTPNYFYLPNVVKELSQVMRGYGSGATVNHILEINTFGHHWRLYSSKDIRRYFSLLSPDFEVTRILYTHPIFSRNPLKKLIQKILAVVPFFREYLYCEIRLDSKKAGLNLKPHW